MLMRIWTTLRRAAPRLEREPSAVGDPRSTSTMLEQKPSISTAAARRARRARRARGRRRNAD